MTYIHLKSIQNKQIIYITHTLFVYVIHKQNDTMNFRTPVCISCRDWQAIDFRSRYSALNNENPSMSICIMAISSQLVADLNV